MKIGKAAKAFKPKFDLGGDLKRKTKGTPTDDSNKPVVDIEIVGAFPDVLRPDEPLQVKFRTGSGQRVRVRSGLPDLLQAEQPDQREIRRADNQRTNNRPGLHEDIRSRFDVLEVDPGGDGYMIWHANDYYVVCMTAADQQTINERLLQSGQPPRALLHSNVVQGIFQ